MANVHLNEDIYMDPTKFNPGRFTKGKEEDQKETYAYIRWDIGEFLYILYSFPDWFYL